MWVFGYGSLLWKVDFPYDEKKIGYIEGYKRRFWQLSTDHRGIPGKPGRVVTLIPQCNEKVWGVAYRIPSKEAVQIKNQLDIREQQGYQSVEVTFNPRDGNQPPFNISLYIATSDNPLYNPASDDEIATVIQTAIGASGKNADYLLNLAEYLRINIPEELDQHLFHLESLVKNPT